MIIWNISKVFENKTLPSKIRKITLHMVSHHPSMHVLTLRGRNFPCHQHTWHEFSVNLWEAGAVKWLRLHQCWTNALCKFMCGSLDGRSMIASAGRRWKTVGKQRECFQPDWTNVSWCRFRRSTHWGLINIAGLFRVRDDAEKEEIEIERERKFERRYYFICKRISFQSTSS